VVVAQQKQGSLRANEVPITMFYYDMNEANAIGNHFIYVFYLCPRCFAIAWHWSPDFIVFWF
jgi:hypothetical protein